MEKEKKQRKKLKRKQKLAIALAVFIFFVGAVLGGLQLGVVWADASWEHWYPDYEKQDISAILQKDTLTDADYDLLYAQTGLTKLGIDGLLEEGNIRQILNIQDFYFEEHTVSCERFNPYTYSEKLEEGKVPLAKLEDGDIIVTATTHVSVWRLGHAALVVDGDSNRLLEAFGPGDVSVLTYASTFTGLADLMVLRPKFPEEFRAEVAAYARENMQGAKYSFWAGIFHKKYSDSFEYTQCAHVAWYAYKHFGVDLDSNGGLVVTPPEIANSPYVEVVQIFGFDPDKLWS